MSTWAELVEGLHADVESQFGEPVLYQPTVGSSRTIQAEFDRAGISTEIQAGVAIQTTRPKLWLRGSLLALEPRQGDTWTPTRDGLTYEVVEVVPCGHGSWTLWGMEV